MATYVYRCPECGASVEKQHPMQVSPMYPCPYCLVKTPSKEAQKVPMRRVLTTPNIIIPGGTRGKS